MIKILTCINFMIEGLATNIKSKPDAFAPSITMHSLGFCVENTYASALRVE